MTRVLHAAAGLMALAATGLCCCAIVILATSPDPTTIAAPAFLAVAMGWCAAHSLIGAAFASTPTARTVRTPTPNGVPGSRLGSTERPRHNRLAPTPIAAYRTRGRS